MKLAQRLPYLTASVSITYPQLESSLSLPGITITLMMV
jgi:hypothetical protein